MGTEQTKPRGDVTERVPGPTAQGGALTLCGVPKVGGRFAKRLSRRKERRWGRVSWSPLTEAQAAATKGASATPGPPQAPEPSARGRGTRLRLPARALLHVAAGAAPGGLRARPPLRVHTPRPGRAAPTFTPAARPQPGTAPLAPPPPHKAPRPPCHHPCVSMVRAGRESSHGGRQ